MTLQQPPQDKVAVRVIVIGVVLTMVFAVVAVFVLIYTHRDPKDILPLATGALGLAGGFLARTVTDRGTLDDSPPTPVVVTPDQQPIPVEPVSPGGGDVPLPDAPVDGGGDESGGVAVRRPDKTTRGRR